MSYRIWDKDNKYLDGLLKEYKHWSLDISYRQHTLGCFIIFAKRDVQKISELTTDELIELRTIMQQMEEALTNISEIKPDKFNYLQLGNNMNHLHIHGIPRYATKRDFAGKEWIDETWGHPPVWHMTQTDKKIVMQVKDKVLEKL